MIAVTYFVDGTEDYRHASTARRFRRPDGCSQIISLCGGCPEATHDKCRYMDQKGKFMLQRNDTMRRAVGKMPAGALPLQADLSDI